MIKLEVFKFSKDTASPLIKTRIKIQSHNTDIEEERKRDGEMGKIGRERGEKRKRERGGESEDKRERKRRRE